MGNSHGYDFVTGHSCDVLAFIGNRTAVCIEQTGYGMKNGRFTGTVGTD